MGNAEVQLPPDANQRRPVPLKPHRTRLERRSDDGQNDLGTAMGHTDPGREDGNLAKFPPAMSLRQNACTDRDNSGGANVVRFAPSESALVTN